MIMHLKVATATENKIYLQKMWLTLQTAKLRKMRKALNFWEQFLHRT